MVNNNNQLSLNDNSNKYAFNQPWKDNSEYFEDFKKHVDNKNIESYTRLQLEILDRAMDTVVMIHLKNLIEI